MTTVQRTAAVRRSTFFVTAGSVVLLLVFIGFSGTFYLRGIVPARSAAQPLNVYLTAHGVVMTVWCILFVVQASLVLANRADLHRRLGVAGIVVAGSFVVAGLYATLRQPQYHVSLGMPLSVHRERMPFLGLLVSNLVTLASFAGLVAAAIWLRRRRDWHGRFMLWSFLLTLGPALSGARSLTPLLVVLMGNAGPFIVLGLLAVAPFVHDWMKLRRIHPATVTALLVVVAGFPLTSLLARAEWMREFYRGLAG